MKYVVSLTLTKTKPNGDLRIENVVTFHNTSSKDEAIGKAIVDALQRNEGFAVFLTVALTVPDDNNITMSPA